MQLTNRACRGQLPDGWSEFVPHEGRPFFYHREQVRFCVYKYGINALMSCFKRILTDAWLWSPDVSARLVRFIHDLQILRASLTFDMTVPEDADVVLDLVLGDDEDKDECQYYYACHSEQTLCWLRDFDINVPLEGGPEEMETHQSKFSRYLENCTC